MKGFQILVAYLILAASSAAHSAIVYVQHGGSLTQNPLLAFDSGPGFSLNANLQSGLFQIFANTSTQAPVSNNFSGTLAPVSFTNNTGATVFLSAGAISARVQADFFNGPAEGGTDFATTMRTSGDLFVRVLGGAGQGDYQASFGYQARVFYNPDGSIKDIFTEYLPRATNGAWVSTGSGGGIGGANVSLATPPLRLDPGARLQLSFSIGGDASISSSTNVFNTLLFATPPGVTLTDDVGLPLAWVVVPEPEPTVLLMAGLAFIGFADRYRRPQRSGI